MTLARRSMPRTGFVTSGGSADHARLTSAGALSTGARIPLHYRAMPRVTEPIPLSNTLARRIWLRAQRLDTSEPFGEGASAVADAVGHLGYVQIDTINVIERCHHHILFTRIPAYRRSDLRQAQSTDKSVFEYWTHALSYVPSKGFQLLSAGDEGAQARRPQMVLLGHAVGYQQGDAARRVDDMRLNATCIEPAR